jgi:hypothetical protein
MRVGNTLNACMSGHLSGVYPSAAEPGP